MHAALHLLDFDAIRLKNSTQDIDCIIKVRCRSARKHVSSQIRLFRPTVHRKMRFGQHGETGYSVRTKRVDVKIQNSGFNRRDGRYDGFANRIGVVDLLAASPQLDHDVPA